MRPARIRLFPVGPLVPVPRLTEEQCGLVDEIEGLGVSRWGRGGRISIGCYGGCWGWGGWGGGGVGGGCGGGSVGGGGGGLGVGGGGAGGGGAGGGPCPARGGWWPARE